MTALIDTSVLVGSTTPVLRESWVVSVVSIGELHAGVLVAADPAARAGRLQRLTAILAEAPVIGIGPAIAARYGELRAASGRQPTNDLWIAATALAHDLTLITGDRRLASLPLIRATLVT